MSKHTLTDVESPCALRTRIMLGGDWLNVSPAQFGVAEEHLKQTEENLTLMLSLTESRRQYVANEERLHTLKESLQENKDALYKVRLIYKQDIDWCLDADHRLFDLREAVTLHQQGQRPLLCPVEEFELKIEGIAQERTERLLKLQPYFEERNRLQKQADELCVLQKQCTELRAFTNLKIGEILLQLS